MRAPLRVPGLTLAVADLMAAGPGVTATQHEAAWPGCLYCSVSLDRCRTPVNGLRVCWPRGLAKPSRSDASPDEGDCAFRQRGHRSWLPPSPHVFAFPGGVRSESRETPSVRIRVLAFPGHLGRWCRLRSYLDSAAAYGITALDAISSAIAGNPWLPPLPALA